MPREWQEDKRDDAFEWGLPERTAIEAGRPVVGQEVVLMARHGGVANCDVFLSVPSTWLTGITTTGANLIPTIRTYQLVQGVPYLLNEYTVKSLQVQTINSANVRFRLIVARGLVCDGFQVSVNCIPLPNDTLLVGTWGRAAQGRMYSWGTETAAGPVGNSDSNSATFVKPALSSHLIDIVGNAPDGSLGGLATPIPSSTLLVNGLTISNDFNSTDILYVGGGPFGIGDLGIELKPGDAIDMPVRSASLVYVNGGKAGVVYRAEAWA